MHGMASWLTIGRSFKVEENIRAFQDGTHVVERNVQTGSLEGAKSVSLVPSAQKVASCSPQTKPKRKREKKSKHKLKHEKDKKHKHERKKVSYDQAIMSSKNSSMQIATQSDDDDCQSSVHFDTSSDEELTSKDPTKHNIDFRNTNLSSVDVVYLPNGQVALLDKDRDRDTAAYEWSIDIKSDRSILLFAGISEYHHLAADPKSPPKHALAMKRSIFSDRFCDDWMEWDTNRWESLMDSATTPSKHGKDRSRRYYSRSFAKYFSNLNLRRFSYKQLRPVNRFDPYSIFEFWRAESADTSGTERGEMVTQFGFVAVPHAAVDDAEDAVQESDKALVGSDSQLAFQRLKYIRNKFNFDTLSHSSLRTFLDYLFSQSALNLWSLWSSGGMPRSQTSMYSCREWVTDRAIADRMNHLIEERLRSIPDEAGRPALHLTRLKLAIHHESPEQVQRMWKDVLSSCPVSFELRLARWSQLLCQASSVKTLREMRLEHGRMMAALRNDLLNLHAARALNESLQRGGFWVSEDLPQPLQEDISAVSVDAFLQLVFFERQVGNAERATSLTQVLCCALHPFVSVLSLDPLVPLCRTRRCWS